MLDQLNAGPAGRAVLRELHADVGHTVHFAMLLGDEAVYVEKLVDPDLPYQTASRVGMRIPLHCTAIGKSLLAAMPPEEVAAPAGPRQADAPDREDDRHARARCARSSSACAERRFAIDDEENERNIRCVGSAVLDHRGRPAGAVSVSALTVELSYDDALALGPRVGRGGASAVARRSARRLGERVGEQRAEGRVLAQVVAEHGAHGQRPLGRRGGTGRAGDGGRDLLLDRSGGGSAGRAAAATPRPRGRSAPARAPPPAARARGRAGAAAA